MKRFLVAAAGIAAAFFAAFHPAPVLALDATSMMIGGDPTSNFASLGQSWFGPLQALGMNLYIALFTIELVIVGYYAVLYKDNIAELFQTMIYKFAMAMVFMGLIANAGTLFPRIIGMFQRTALSVVSTTDSKMNTGGLNNVTCTGGGGVGSQSYSYVDKSGNTQTGSMKTFDEGCSLTNPIALEGVLLGWSVPYFLAADGAKAADEGEGAAAGIEVFGTALPGLSNAFMAGHDNFEIFCIAMGMTLVTAAMSILLTYLLLTFETQIVMSIGVIFLAFQGSRFTAQFSQGYISYCVNIGTKFFVFYFVIGILDDMFFNGPIAGEIVGTLGGLIAGALIPFGAGSIAIAALTSPIPLMGVITGILVNSVPNFAGSLLSGTSALSASATMSNLASSMQGASSMNKSQSANRKAGKELNDSRAQTKEISQRQQGGDRGLNQNGAQVATTSTADTNAAMQAQMHKPQATPTPQGADGSKPDASANAHGGANGHQGSVGLPGGPSGGGGSGESGAKASVAGGSDGGGGGADGAGVAVAEGGSEGGEGSVAAGAGGQTPEPSLGKRILGWGGRQVDRYKNRAKGMYQGTIGAVVADAKSAFSSNDAKSPAVDQKGPQPQPVSKPQPQAQAQPQPQPQGKDDASAAVSGNGTSNGASNGASGGGQAPYELPASMNLSDAAPEDVARMTPQDFGEALGAGPNEWQKLPPATKEAVLKNPQLRAVAGNAARKREAAATEAMKNLDQTSALTSFGAFVGKGEAPPTAVQVRISNSDKPQ